MFLDARRRRAVRRLIMDLTIRHGPQGWWPVRCERGLFAESADERHQRGYHPREIGFPRTRGGRWEIVTGAVLTQNTAWTNVEQALDALTEARITTPEAVLDLDVPTLGTLVRHAGYYNQKSGYLREVAVWFIATDPTLAAAKSSRSTLEVVRPELLSVRGVGPETADSILLYAYSQPTFVIDAYTRRVLDAAGLVTSRVPYEALRAVCETALRGSDDPCATLLWQEAHAVLVEEAKAQRRSMPKQGGSRRQQPGSGRGNSPRVPLSPHRG